MSKSMILRNAMSRPVEIHLADRVEVILPGERLQIEDAELSDPGVRPLVHSGVLSCFEAPAQRSPKQSGSPRRRAKTAPAPKPRQPATGAKKRIAAPPETSPPALTEHRAPANETSGGRGEGRKVRSAPADPDQTETST